MNSMVTSNRPDAELALLAAGCDAEAFEEIHGRYRNFVYGLAMRMTRNEADAEDLTQDSFISVLRRVGSFRGESSFATWLYRLVVNQVRMHFRYRSKRPEVLTSDGEIDERGQGVSRRGETDRAIDRLAIEEAARSLPPGYRAAFILHDVKGYGHEEVAGMMGWTAGTSKSQLHRARAGMRKRLRRGRQCSRTESAL